MARNETVAHAWAHQTGRDRNGSSMHWNGPTAYSYRMAVARHVVGADGMPAVLITTDRPSNSTAVHVGLLRDACNHLRRFDVPDVGAASVSRHLENHRSFIDRAADAAQRSARARTQAASHLDRAQRAVDDANAYAAVFALSVAPVELDHLDAAVAEAERRAARQRVAENEDQRTRAAEAARSIRSKVRAWLGGDRVHVRTPIPMVRVVGDRVETTWGASASLAAALKAYHAAQICRRDRITMKGPDIDHWGAARIDERGTITVGCHRVPFRFVQLAARLAGIESLPAGEERA